MPRRSRNKNTPRSDTPVVPRNVWIQNIAEQEKKAETVKANLREALVLTGQDKQIFNGFTTMVNFNKYIQDRASAVYDYKKYKNLVQFNVLFLKSVQYIRKLLKKRQKHWTEEQIQDIARDNPINFSNIEDLFRFCEELVLPEEEETKLGKAIDNAIDTIETMERDKQKLMHEAAKARIEAMLKQAPKMSSIEDDSVFPKLGTTATTPWISVKSKQDNKRTPQREKMTINIQRGTPYAPQNSRELPNKQIFKKKFCEYMRDMGVDETSIQNVYSKIPDQKQQDTSEEAVQKAIQNYIHIIAGNSSVYMPSHGYAAGAPACHALTYAAPVAYAGPHAMTYAAADCHPMAYAAPVAYTTPGGALVPYEKTKMVNRMSELMDQYFRDFRILDNVTKLLIENLTKYVKLFYVYIKVGRSCGAREMWDKLRQYKAYPHNVSFENLRNSPAIWDHMVQQMQAQVRTDLGYTDSVEPGDLLDAVPGLTWKEMQTKNIEDTFTQTTYAQKCEENSQEKRAQNKTA